MEILLTTLKSADYKRYYTIVNLETLTVYSLVSNNVLLFKNYENAQHYIDYMLFAKDDYTIVPAINNYSNSCVVTFPNKSFTTREDNIIGVINHFNLIQGEDYINTYEIIHMDEDIINVEILNSHVPITINFETKEVYYYNYDDTGARLLDGEKMRRIGMFMNMLEDMLKEEDA